MNFLEDRKIKKIAKYENIKASDKYFKTIDETLESLTDKNENINLRPMWKNSMKLAMAMTVLTFIILPNISPKISYAMQELPIIGNIVKVITIRNYFDKEGNSELDADVPSIKNNDNTVSDSNKIINDEIKELTQRIIDNYYAEKNPDNHISIKIKSQIITNTNEWFTLKLAISQTSASSSLEYKYYHIDKKTDKIVKLSDLFANDGYTHAISEEIKKQMISRMKENKNIVYWLDEESEDWNFRKIDDNQNFYFSENGNIVIVFDKYEVGPGSSGAPEFEINKEIYKKYMNKDN